MIITCSECQARFRLADEKLKPGGTKVRCSKCKHVFTVAPPEAPPVEEAVDYGEFNMERVADEEAAPAVPPVPPAAPPAPSAEPAVPADGTDLDFDFSGLEQSLGPGVSDNELAEEFSFADTSAAAETATGDSGEQEQPGELDFDATFAESEEPPSLPTAVGPAEVAFDQEFATDRAAGEDAEGAGFGLDAEPADFTFDEGFPAGEAATTIVDGADFDFAAAPEAPAAETFDFAATEQRAGLDEFGFETEAGAAAAAFGEEPAAGATGFEFPSDEGFESAALPAEPVFGETPATDWEQPDKADALSFDFDEPSFEAESQAAQPPSAEKPEGNLGFGEIDFSESSDETPAFGKEPAFGAEPDFSQATLARPAEPEPSPPPPPPQPRPAASRPHGEPLPAPAPPRKGPLSRVLLLLALLLVLLCGAGGYFYFMGGGQQVVERLLQKVKGEEPAGPTEQRISLAIAGSSYVDNREAGQLLVIQGSATNNFSGPRSAITVKGLIVDASGKVLQQQTVFCGNYLGEEKLRTMTYAQIEEAMNNQFGDSLSNMNLKAGAAIRFTIVFRNVPKEMATINVEVVDSKPGGL